MKRKDIWTIAVVLLLAGGVLFLSGILSGEGAGTPGGQLPETAPAAAANAAVTHTPEGAGQPEAASGGVPALVPAEAYLSVQIDTVIYDPIPLLEENQLELVQQDGKRNVVAFNRQGLRMHSASCDNQDCVQQGEVTLENKDSRVLMNAIICLPNKVVLTLLDAQEAQAQWARLYPPR